jgi:hypothetical protein
MVCTGTTLYIGVVGCRVKCCGTEIVLPTGMICCLTFTDLYILSILNNFRRLEIRKLCPNNHQFVAFNDGLMGAYFNALVICS